MSPSRSPGPGARDEHVEDPVLRRILHFWRPEWRNSPLEGARRLLPSPGPGSAPPAPERSEAGRAKSAFRAVLLTFFRSTLKTGAFIPLKNWRRNSTASREPRRRGAAPVPAGERGARRRRRPGARDLLCAAGAARRGEHFFVSVGEPARRGAGPGQNGVRSWARTFSAARRTAHPAPQEPASASRPAPSESEAPDPASPLPPARPPLRLRGAAGGASPPARGRWSSRPVVAADDQRYLRAEPARHAAPDGPDEVLLQAGGASGSGGSGWLARCSPSAGQGGGEARAGLNLHAHRVR